MRIIKGGSRREPHGIFGIENEESRPTLESISIKNFKSLGDWNEIPIRPITLIFGKNSAGKSSVLHSILWLRDILPLGNINLRWLSKSADFVDLGYLNEFLYKSPSQKSDSIGFRIKLKDNKKIAKEFLKDQILNTLEKLIQENQEIDENLSAEKPVLELLQRAKHQLSQGENQLFEKMFAVNGFDMLELEVEFDLAESLKRKKTTKITPKPNIKIKINDKPFFSFARLDKQTPSVLEEPFGDSQEELPEYQMTPGEQFDELFDNLYFSLFTNDYKQAHFKSESIAKIKMRAAKELETRLEWKPINTLGFGFKIFAKKAYRARFRGIGSYAKMENEPKIKILPSQRIFGRIQEEAIYFFFNLFRYSFRTLFRKLSYLAAYRKYPARFSFDQQYIDKIFDPYGGESVQSIVDNPVDLKLLSRACGKLGSNFEVKTKALFASILGKGIRFIHLKNNKELSFRDIGFGWSQVFPVLSEIVSDESSLLMIEQPELHLHPKAQSDLMEIIVDQIIDRRPIKIKDRYKKELDLRNPMILEAHSEQMVIRLLRLISEKRLGPDDVSILYIKHDGEKSVIEKILINEQGDIGNQWPGGFFESAYKDFER